jgi:hypothetical protein
MHKFILFVCASLFAANLAFADVSCDAKAVDKNGKPLKGAAKTSFIKKCEKDSGMAAKSDCASKALDKNGKPLKGAAKNAFIKKCEKDTSSK